MTSQTINEEEIRRIFREEAVVAKADLRVDVARAISRLVVRDDETTLDEKTVRTRGNYQVSRGSRDRVVVGNYERTVGGDELVTGRSVTTIIEEYVNGGADLKAQVESEAIIGGAYVNTVAGVYLRMAAWVDYLIWGGWAEADVARTEIAGLMIRSYMAYSHAVGIRLTACSRLVDDFMNRVETFGSLNETYASKIHLGNPAGGVKMEN